MSFSPQPSPSVLLLVRSPWSGLEGLFRARGWHVETDPGRSQGTSLVVVEGPESPRVEALRSSGIPVFWLAGSPGEKVPEAARTGDRGGDLRVLEDLLGAPSAQPLLPAHLLGEVLPGVIHDACNLLGVILGFAELMQDDLSRPQEDREGLAAILSAVERCKELLEVTRELSSERPEESRSLGPREVLERVSLVSRKQLLHRGVGLEIRHGEGGGTIEASLRVATLCLLGLVLELAQRFRRKDGGGKISLVWEADCDRSRGFRCEVHPPEVATREESGEGRHVGMAMRLASSLGWRCVATPQGYFVSIT